MPLVAPNKPARNGSIRHAGATPPRVLLVCANRLNFNGGAKVETVQLVRALADAGSAVGLLVDDGSPDLHPAVQRFTLSFAPKRNATIRKEIRHALEVFKPDVVHVIGAGVRTARAVEAVCSRGPGAPPVPWAITLHNLCPREYDVPWCVGRNRRWRALRNLRYAPVTALWGGVLKRARYGAAICHSQHVVNLARGRGVPADRTRLIPLTLADEPADEPAEPKPARALFPPGASPRLTSVGGFSHRKGFHDAIRAAARLAQVHPRLHYAVIGGRQNDRYVRHLEALIERLGLAGRVSLHLDAPADAKRATLQACDLYLQPSHEEGFCLAFLEAARLAPRLLGTAAGAMAEMTAGDPHGAVVDPGQPAALAAAARRLLAAPVDAAVLPARRRFLARGFGEDDYLSRHLDLFCTLSGRPAAATASAS